MTFIERTMIRGIRCDKQGCSRTILGEELPGFYGREDYDSSAKAIGWSQWVGRSMRHYCPDHGPSKSNSNARRPMQRIY